MDVWVAIWEAYWYLFSAVIALIKGKPFIWIGIASPLLQHARHTLQLKGHRRLIFLINVRGVPLLWGWCITGGSGLSGGTHWNGIEHQNRGRPSSLFLTCPPRWQAERFKLHILETCTEAALHLHFSFRVLPSWSRERFSPPHYRQTSALISGRFSSLCNCSASSSGSASSPRRGVKVLLLWLVKMRLKGIIILLIHNVVN